MPRDANRQYFWRVYTSADDYYYIDAFDVCKANWMRYVNPAYSSESQNLVACQSGQAIYFYAFRDIAPKEELLVWYCREFAERLNYPLTAQAMQQRIRESERANRREYAANTPRIHRVISYKHFVAQTLHYTQHSYIREEKVANRFLLRTTRGDRSENLKRFFSTLLFHRPTAETGPGPGPGIFDRFSLCFFSPLLLSASPRFFSPSLSHYSYSMRTANNCIFSLYLGHGAILTLNNALISKWFT